MQAQAPAFPSNSHSLFALGLLHVSACADQGLPPSGPFPPCLPDPGKLNLPPSPPTLTLCLLWACCTCQLAPIRGFRPVDHSPPTCLIHASSTSRLPLQLSLSVCSGLVARVSLRRSGASAQWTIPALPA